MLVKPWYTSHEMTEAKNNAKKKVDKLLDQKDTGENNNED